LLGWSVGPYQVVSKLGSGGMGEVYLGHDPRLQRRVALKCLTTRDTSTLEIRARIMREARAAARLNHPNIAAVYDVHEQDGRTFIVMEYVEGESLAALLTRQGTLPIGEVRRIGRQLASALGAAHAHGVVHRDLKPANIHVTPDGTIKVLDFGVAKVSQLVSSDSVLAGNRSMELTLPGNPGTPIYMSPEQLFSRPIDARSDIYGAGVILYQMAIGRRPFEETSAVALALAMSSRVPRPPRAINPDVPPDLSAAIEKALERDPDRRFQSAGELEEALQSTTQTAAGVDVHGGVHALPSSGTWKVLAAAAALLAAVVTAGLPLYGTLRQWLKPAARSPRPAVLAVLPVDNPTGDVHAEYLGAGIAGVVASNFGSIPGLTVLPGSATAPFQNRRSDMASLKRDLAATHVVDLTMRSAAPHPALVARIRRTDTGSIDWERRFEGDVLTVERALLDDLGKALQRDGAFSRELSPAEWARIQKLPTASAAALQAYSEARALLDRYDVPGNVDRGIALLKQAIADDPKFATAHATLGDALWRRYQDIDRRPEVAAEATAAVMEALRLDPDAAQVYRSLGNMQFQTGHHEEAVRSLRRALQLQPDSDETHSLLGRVLGSSGDVEAALSELRQAIALRPYWNNYFSLGLVSYTNGRYRDAIDAFQKTTELQPTYSPAYQMLGTTYHMLGDLPQAIGNYEHAARLGPNPAAYANLALAYYTVKRYDEARVAYLEAIRLAPTKAGLRRDLADVYTRLGRERDARAMYEQAISLAQQDLKVNSRDAIAVALIAICEAKIGRRGEAERHAAEAITLAPNSFDVRIRVGKVYAALNDRAAALNAVRTAVALGYEPKMLRDDDEFGSLRSDPEFEQSIAAGLTARSSKGASR
jgi:tetratricopeptide (TPR) repeat protein/predicted Ser/Thr protein kinase